MDYFNPKNFRSAFSKRLKNCRQIVDSLNRDKKDLIIEIGPEKEFHSEIS